MFSENQFLVTCLLTISTNDKMCEKDGIYFNFLMEKNDFTTTVTHNLLSQSWFKQGSKFTASTNDKIWNKTVFRHSLCRSNLVRVMFEKKKMIKEERVPGWA